MRNFFEKSRGSITVFVALILVPTVFFSGFLVDLARLKLYGNQAVMTADNYGEAVLTQYDNLLKELYGLFAVTQGTDGANAIAQLDELQKYVQSSFNPSDHTVSWEYMQSVLGQTAYDGFMPYKDAEISLDYEVVKEANLGTPEVLGTQIGDFMQFRIAQQLLGDGSELLDTVASVQNMENNAKLIDKKLELDKEAEKMYELAREYYEIVRDFTAYPEYIRGINDTYSVCGSQFSEIIGSSHYQVYHDYQAADRTAMDAAVEKRKRIEDGENEDSSEAAEEGETDDGSNETLSEEEQKLLDIYDAYMEDEEAREDVLEQEFDAAISMISSARDRGVIRFDNFYDRLVKLEQKANEIVRKGDDLRKLQQELRELLGEENLSEDLKTGVQEELNKMESLFDQLEYYTGIASWIRENNAGVNDAYESQTEQIISRLEEIKDWYLECNTENPPEWTESLEESRWVDFQSKREYQTLYKSLEKCFGQGGDENEGKKKKDKANEMLKQAEEDMDKDEETGARDIPESFHYGTSYQSLGFDLSDMVDDAVGAFSANHFQNEMNRLILKLYTVEYDFGMFSSRVTNISDGADHEGQKEVSLTGYEKAANINYLYQAELEYILGGSNSSKENLNGARNKILAFRAVVNFTATYRVKEVNNLIKSISDSAAAVNPILGLAVNGALRLAVAGLETAKDWENLKKGESVFLEKKQLNELSAYDTVKELLNLPDRKGESKAFRMDYSQYLMVMMIFFTSAEEVTQRTSNLIELNVNTVQQKIGSSGTLTDLEFQMSHAYTAVNAVCKVHLDFVVMPQGFARAVADDYAGLEEFQKNSYQFTVTRGY